MTPRRCRYLIVTKELMAEMLFGDRHFHVPSDARLICYEKQPMNDDFFVLVFSDTYDYIPEGKPFPVVKVPFLQRGQPASARITPANQGEQR